MTSKEEMQQAMQKSERLNLEVSQAMADCYNDKTIIGRGEKTILVFSGVLAVCAMIGGLAFFPALLAGALYGAWTYLANLNYRPSENKHDPANFNGTFGQS